MSGQRDQLNEKINFYVINLDRSVDRMEGFKKEFANFPIPYIRVSGVDGSQITLPHPEYAQKRFFIFNGCEATPGEIGCYFSHIKVIRQFLESDKEFALICEDDAIPLPETAEVIENALQHSSSWDFLRLHGGRSKTSFPYRHLAGDHQLCTTITGMTSSVTYIINRKAAKKMILKYSVMCVPYDIALLCGKINIREASVMPNVILPGERNSTVRHPEEYKSPITSPYYWSCRLNGVWVRIVRYSLQIGRIISRRLSNK